MPRGSDLLAGGLDVVVVEGCRVVVLGGDEVTRVLEEVGGGGRDALEGVSPEHAQRGLYPELVLLARAGDHEVDVERILDDVSDLLDDEEHPADDGHHRDHLPLERVDEDEGEREAPHREEAGGVAGVGGGDRRLDDALARSHDVAELRQAALSHGALRDQRSLHHAGLERVEVLARISALPPPGKLLDVGVALAKDGGHHLDEGERPVARLPQEVDVRVSEAPRDGRKLRLGQQRRAVDRLEALEMLEEDGGEDGEARQEVLPLVSGKVDVRNASDVAGVVHQRSPQLASLPETVISSVRAEH
mmetsp:Transcript_52805/g.124722  ORF Transcript_52805/g.124722 Transcript_52805/m.124722 type:complete len:304 (+) Transcript_52805:217-1128(+)